MMKDQWLQLAMKNDDLVAELLLRWKHSSDSVSLDAPPSPPPPATETTAAAIRTITTVLPPRWGHRKNRSKSTAPIATVTNGIGKEHRRSPTTHLSWSGGGGGGSSSDSPSDLSSGSRSVKANEGVSISSYNNNSIEKSNKKRRIGKKMRSPVMINRNVQISEASERRFITLPDLNMTPDDEDFFR